MIKILAIDDNTDNLISLKAIIKDAFPVSAIDAVTNGPKGIELALTKEPDVILLDILMPGMDGFEVCRLLKQDERLKDIPVVFLTAVKETKQSRIRALEIGAEAFLSKPIDESELTAQIKAMVKIKEANRSKRDEKERLSALVVERTHELEKSYQEMVKLLNELKVSEARFRSLFEFAMDGVLIVEADSGTIIDSNKSLSDMLCIPYEQIVGEKAWNIGSRIAKNYTRKSFERLQCMGSSRYESIPIRTADGRKLYIEAYSNTFTVDTKRFFQCNVRDITERVQAEKQIRTLSNAIEQVASSIVITDEKGDIEFVNKKFTSLTQYSLEDVKGRKPRIFNRGHMSEKEYEAFLETLQSGKTWKGEVMNRKKDNTYYWEETIVSNIRNPDGVTSRSVLIMNDITEKKQMLDDLIKAKEKAEESDRLKSAFLANMSHEIRTPLNCIIGFSDLMLDPEFDRSKMKEFVKMINVGGSNMLTIINDIMDISKIQTGQLTLQPGFFPVNELVADVYKEFFAQANEKGLELRADASCLQNPIYVNSDENKLKQILGNLVNNAIKFSKCGTVEFGFNTREDSLVFYVRDKGIGIAPEFHEKIFERFSQVESDYTREYGGNGLGLAISRSLVLLLGGEIWMESEVGKGSVFYFSIPA